MSEPSIFTFGVAKYVYASAYDDVKSENEKLKAEIAGLEQDFEESSEITNRQAHEIIRLRDKVEALMSILKKYGKHLDDETCFCRTYVNSSYECTCGFEHSQLTVKGASDEM